MGKELSTQESLNSYELSNNKSTVYLWLHQVLDGVKSTKFATFENLVNAGYALLQNAFTWDNIQNKPDTYPPDAHAHAQYLESVAWSIITDKPSTYPPETHSHDYVPLSQGLTICSASWVGDGESEREITLSGTPLIHTLRSIDLSIGPTVYFWHWGYPAKYLKTISSSGISGIYNQWEFNPDSSTFDIISADINTPGSTYRLFLLGYRTT